MLRLEFNDFQKKLEKDKIVDHYATVHCMITEKGFYLIMKSREKWDYYTFMSFDEILRFGEEHNMDVVEAFDMFMTNYCSNTLKVLPAEKEKIMEDIKEVEEPVEIIDDITKSPLFGNQSNPGPSSLINPLGKNQAEIIDSGDDLINDAKDYSDFLFKFFEMLEKRVLIAANDVSDMVGKSYIDKTFGEFMRNLFNVVNTKLFADKVRGFLRIDLVNGLVSAEAETGMDIGFNDVFQDKLNQLAFQQIDGYTINGRKWPGIKGVTKEIQANVIRTVQGGVNEGLGLKEIKENIKKDFDNFSDWRANMISRTETTRITNEGKILGYKETGISGKKVWSAALDHRTSPICRRLNGQVVSLDDDFIDSETRLAFGSPPAHVNCRSTVFFKPN